MTSLLVSLLFCTVMVFAQGISISGSVTDGGDPIPGVTVMVKGTVIGAATDMNGRFEITAPNEDAVLQFSFVGYTTVEMVVGSRRSFDIEMTEDTQMLDEVVVIGYGVLKKKLVTGATIQVAGENLQRMSTTNTLTALQSQTPGVTIMQTNGQPGSDLIVNIRGIGTNGEARPLYVIDGVPAGNNGLNHMSPADIESIDILKDAASAGIYGARAANGVVLVTTKQGKSGKPRLTYDGSYGRQYMYKKPDVLSPKEYMMITDEVRFNQNQPLRDWERILPDGMYDDVMSGRWKGSDWIDAFYCKGAPTQQHAFNLTGGNDVSKFSMGYSFADSKGILGEAVQSHYGRHTVRLNSDHVLLKVNGFDAIKIGQTLSYNYRENNGISTGNIYWNAFRGVLVANPLMPIYNEEGNYYDYYDKERDKWGDFADFANPIGSVVKNSQGLNLYKNHGLRTSAYLQIQPISGLIFKSQFSYNMSASSNRTQTQKSRWSNNAQTTTESVNQDQSVGYGWTLENTLLYNLSINSHNLSFLLGQSAEKWGFGENVSAGGNNNIFDLGWDYAWVNNLQPTELSQRSAGGGPWGEGAIASFFGRITYNFRETYMATVSLRADGSSNFMRGNRWGTFPGVSAGWVLSNESFMDNARKVLNFLKLRGSWGQNGNSSISNFQYLSRYNFRAQDNYFFGADKKTPSTGATAGVLKNPDVTWETQEQTNVGFDAYFLSSRLGVVFDYYVRTTKDWLLDAPISATWGFSSPRVNGGEVENKGVELSLSWNDRKGDFTYGIIVNGDYKKNKVNRIDNLEGIINGTSNVLSQGTTTFTRLQVGEPMGFFYGWKADGIFQNQAEVDAYRNAAGNLIIPSAQPGDVRFRDIAGGGENGKDPDGRINEADKTNIGCGWPVYTLGFQLNLGYKGFDFSVIGNGSFGHQLAKSYRRFVDSPNENYTTDVYQRWTGEGTSNKWPRLTAGNHINMQQVSDIFLESGNYLRIQNITLGYDLKRLLPQMPLGQLRVYFSALNIFTFTKYSGMDPEVGFGDGLSWVSGIDLGFYPASRTYLFGFNVSF